MTDAESAIPGSPNESPSGYKGRDEAHQEVPAEPILESSVEARAKTKHIGAMDLVTISEDLRKARRFEFGKAFTAAGCILVGAALGAAVAGQRVDNKYVMLSGIAGILLIVLGVVTWVNRSENVAAANQKLEIQLRNVQDQDAIQRMRDIYSESDDDLHAKLRRRFKKKPSEAA